LVSKGSEAPIILISGYGPSAVALRAKKAISSPKGASACRKPFAGTVAGFGLFDKRIALLSARFGRRKWSAGRVGSWFRELGLSRESLNFQGKVKGKTGELAGA
jgi:hypothetical protein